MLTNEQKLKYEKNPNICPYCGSEDIYVGEKDIDGKTIVVNIECEECEKEWNDIYEFDRIEEI